jgi:2-dehydro-3-deoxygluconokinase
MIELRPSGDRNFAVAYGGDTLNTAVYLARLGSSVDYVTQLGDDVYSDEMLTQWRNEGVGVSLIRQLAGRLPGLYIINNDESGERFFTYWRKESPAREIFDANPKRLFVKLNKYDYLYLTGISLSLYKEAARQGLFDFLDAYREQGGKVVFDVNYRPANWQDQAQAQAVIANMLIRVDIALPSFDDEQALFGFTSTEDCLNHYESHGVASVVLKDGLRGCTLVHNGQHQHFPVQREISPVDTTAAGDSFNAGYLAALLDGKDSAVAVAMGQKCAGLVIQYPGAIIDAITFEQAMNQENTEVQT